jgi:hypothetical protein
MSSREELRTTMVELIDGRRQAAPDEKVSTEWMIAALKALGRPDQAEKLQRLALRIRAQRTAPAP